MARRPASDPTTRHPSQLLALAIGAIYALIGILGFLVTGFDNFAAETNKTLLGFEINPLHNIVHLAIGLAGLALWRTGCSRRGTATSTSCPSTAPTTACTWSARSPGWPSPCGRPTAPSPVRAVSATAASDPESSVRHQPLVEAFTART
jgi:hypothetical protein